MSTVLYPSPIFGPIHSRRLGLSLGINLMPSDGKICSFDCIYCECGFNHDHKPLEKRPTRKLVATSLEKTLQDMGNQHQLPDVITFAGNGEPTSHPDFLGIIQDTIHLRDKYAPNSKISVLSNATYIHRPDIFEALTLVDCNILKLDTVNMDYIHAVNKPNTIYSLDQIVEDMKKFKGHVIIQTMFMKANIGGRLIDNTDESYVAPWIEVLQSIKPQQVMIYTIARETPDLTLEKVSPAQLDAIASRVNSLGIPTTASY